MDEKCGGERGNRIGSGLKLGSPELAHESIGVFDLKWRCAE